MRGCAGAVLFALTATMPCSASPVRFVACIACPKYPLRASPPPPLQRFLRIRLFRADSPRVRRIFHLLTSTCPYLPSSMQSPCCPAALLLCRLDALQACCSPAGLCDCPSLTLLLASPPNPPARAAVPPPLFLCILLILRLLALKLLLLPIVLSHLAFSSAAFPLHILLVPRPLVDYNRVFSPPCADHAPSNRRPTPAPKPAPTSNAKPATKEKGGGGGGRDLGAVGVAELPERHLSVVTSRRGAVGGTEARQRANGGEEPDLRRQGYGRCPKQRLRLASCARARAKAQRVQGHDAPTTCATPSLPSAGACEI